MNDFSNQCVAVTGGYGTLGTVVVDMLLERGATCHVPVFGRDDPEKHPQFNNPRLIFHPGIDLSTDKGARNFFNDCPPLWASIHLAGGFETSSLTKTPYSSFERMWRINAATCFLSCKEAVKRIRVGGLGGRIVNIASRPALVPSSNMVAYGAAKAAVVSMTQTLAKELSAEAIWVNAVAPSILDTPANREAMPKADFSKWPKLDYVATEILKLASPDNSTTSGSIVTAYGGI